MQNWAIILLILGLIAGLLGFSGVGAGSTLTFVFLTAFFVMALTGATMLVLSKAQGRGKFT